MWYTFCAKPMILIDRIVTLRCRSPCGERGLKSCCSLEGAPMYVSLPVRGAWVEIPSRRFWSRREKLSLPVRGAWVEISSFVRTSGCSIGRSPCGERGLKLSVWLHPQSQRCRSPCGERGLKCQDGLQGVHHIGRSPCGERGLKCGVSRTPPKSLWSLPVRGAWVEIASAHSPRRTAHSSLPVRGAWVEICNRRISSIAYRVAPRAGSVG